MTETGMGSKNHQSNGFSPSRKTIYAMLAGVSLVFLIYAATMDTAQAQQKPDNFWKEVDLLKLQLPDNIQDLRSQVVIDQSRKEIEGIDVFYQTAEPLPGQQPAGGSKHMFMLHGAAFTSQTWISQVPTIATLAALGHKVTAIDLPGYGKTSGRARNQGEFLSKAIKELARGDRVVIVTPSMSGGFIIPMLQDYNQEDLIQGWVPVAPVSTGKPGASFFEGLSIPTMIVYGEKDRGLGFSSRDDLVNIPTSTKPQVLPDAGHPAYLDQPDMWHQLLHNFLAAL